MIQWLQRWRRSSFRCSLQILPEHDQWCINAMNILKVGSSPYHFRSTPYMAKATGAVKLFGPRLRCRKAVQVSNLAGSNDVIICDCVNWRFRASFVSYLYVYIALKWSFFFFCKFCHDNEGRPHNQVGGCRGDEPQLMLPAKMYPEAWCIRSEQRRMTGWRPSSSSV